MTRAARHVGRFVHVLCVCASFFCVGALSAQDVSEEREREAKAAFDAGVAAAKVGDYERARAHFQRSRQLVVKASTLLNLAIADLKLGLTEEALFALDALEAPSGPEQERIRQRARKVRSEIEALRGSAAVEPAVSDGPEPAGASAATPEPTRNDPPEVIAPAPVLATAVSEPHAAAPPREVPSLVLPRVLLVLGGALAGGSLGNALWWMNRARAADDCHSDGKICNEKTEITRQRAAAMAVTLSLGVSALTLITSGAVLLAKRKSDQRRTISVSAWTLRSAAGISACGSF